MSTIFTSYFFIYWILFYSNFPIRNMYELDSQPRCSNNESCTIPVTYCPGTTKSTCQTQELNAKENITNTTHNMNKTLIILVLIPPGNLSIQDFNSSSNSHNQCIEKFQESMNISRSQTEMLFFHTNMSLYAISAVIPAVKNEFIMQDITIPACGNRTIKFIGYVKPMLRCAAHNLSCSTRKPTTTTISEKLNSDKIVFTKNEQSITSPWGNFGVKTTRMSVDIIQNVTTKKHSKTTTITTTSWMNTFNMPTITNTSTTVTKRFMPSTITTKVAH